MPPLRERADDIPLLTMFFLEKSARKLGRPVTQVAEGTMARLCAYSWPGNIRELQNVIERAVVLSAGSVLNVDGGAFLDGTARPSPPAVESLAKPISAPVVPLTATGGSALEDVERQHIVTVLQKAKWRIEGNDGAAKILNLEPSTLRSRMKKLGIKRGT
jgi:transcriptional regulator with GAF, ATPase, and Fis domain